jgi:hypothetical protein
MPVTRLPQRAQGTSGHPLGDSIAELLGGRGAAQVPGADLVFDDDLLDGFADAGSGFDLSQVISIIAEASICAAGLAIPFPAISARCRGRSKIEAWVPMLAPGARPSPPTSPDTSSLRMSPNMLVVTITSNCSSEDQLHGAVVHDHVVGLDRPSYSF